MPLALASSHRRPLATMFSPVAGHNRAAHSPPTAQNPRYRSRVNTDSSGRYLRPSVAVCKALKAAMA